MSGDARDFNNMEMRAVFEFFFPAGQGAKGNSHHSDRNIRGTCTIKNWMTQYKRGNFSTCPGRPKTVTTPEIIDHIHELILEDCQSSAKSIAEQLRISREQVGSIHEDFDMRKLSMKWVPKCLNTDQRSTVPVV